MSIELEPTGDKFSACDAPVKSLTILVCTHNRRGLLAQLLDSLNAAELPVGWQIDVMVVANACTDGTVTYLQDYVVSQPGFTRLPLSWLVEPKPGKSQALNRALPTLKSDLVFFEDDDQRVAPDFLVKLCCVADAYPDASIICGRLLPDWRGDEPSWIRGDSPYRIQPNPIPHYDPGLQPLYLSQDDLLPSGGNLVIRLHVIRRIGEFSTALGPRGHNLAGGEDTAYIRKALSFGETLLYHPDILQFHYVDPERLRFAYLATLAYKRTLAVVGIGAPVRHVPLYLPRKLAKHLAAAGLTMNPDKRRYYAIRAAATAGELAGFMFRRFRGLRGGFRPVFGHSQAVGIVAATAVSAVGGAHLTGAVQAAIGAVAVASVLALGLLFRSVRHFSRTGPQLKAEIRRHYRGYAIYALARLGVWTVLVGVGLAIPVFAAWSSIAAVLGRTTGGWPTGALIAISGIGGFTLLQFLRQLLFKPGSLEASLNYRMSRFYPVWRLLWPGLFLTIDRLLWLIFTVSVSAGFIVAARNGDTRLTLGLALLDVATLAVLHLGREPGEPTPLVRRARAARPNFLVIGADSLRFDSVGGEAGNSITPEIDRLVARGMLLEQCFVPCARTAPSLVSFLTGRWPHEHGIRDNFVTVAEADMRVAALPRYLREFGYRTFALSDWCGSDLGKFAFGFDEFDGPEDQWNIRYLIRQGPKDIRLFLGLFAQSRFGRCLIPEIHFLAGVPMTQALGRRTRAAISTLAQSEEPFFLNVFMSSTHAPFGSEYPHYCRFTEPSYAGDSKFVMSGLTEPFEVIHRQGQSKSAFDIEQIRKLYAGCVGAFDMEVGRILKHLECCGLADETIVVIYSDHGMEFFERETWGQGNSVIVDESAHVPVIIADPRSSKYRRVTSPCSSIDIAPMLLEMAGLPVPSTMHGRRLMSGAIDDCEDAWVYSETGIWVTRVPSLEPGHVIYPDLPELLEIPDKAKGTIALKPEFARRVNDARDRMLRTCRWKLVRQPMDSGITYKLFDIAIDPECRVNVADDHPHVVHRLVKRLDVMVAADYACTTERLL